jgi:transcriptional regulator with XRE-family HTH domain
MLISEVTAKLNCNRTELARKLGLRSPGAISNWERRYGGRIPELHARRLQEMTRGKLKFDPKAYEQS